MFTKYFTVQYLFNSPAIALMRSDKAIFYFAAALMILGVLIFGWTFGIRNKLKRRMLRRWANLSFWIGLILAFWFFCRYEMVPYLGMHIAVYVIVLIGLWWLYAVIKYQLTTYKQLQVDADRQSLKNKYLK